MTEFKIGDIVCISLGSPGEPGHSTKTMEVAEFNKSTSVTIKSLFSYEKDGWTIEIVKRPELPTKINTIGRASVNGRRKLVRRKSESEWEAYSLENGTTLLVKDHDLEDFHEGVVIPREMISCALAWKQNEYEDLMESASILDRIADWVEEHA